MAETLLHDLIRYLVIPLILGSYVFTWAVYKKLNRELETILVNHLQHVHEEYQKITERLDKLESK